MRKNKALAYMYDFYNTHTLLGQNDDIQYYINKIKKYKPNKILIVGAGTGRVALPLSKYSQIVALDFDKDRLEVLKEKNCNIDTIAENICVSKIIEKFDMIIFPYSTLQFFSNKDKINIIFDKVAKLMNKNSILLFDVSESFNLKKDTDNLELFNDYCQEIDDMVKVVYTSKQYKEYIEFNVKYISSKFHSYLLETEKYYYYDKNFFDMALRNSKLSTIQIDDGYGNPGFEHKHIYNCKLR